MGHIPTVKTLLSPPEGSFNFGRSRGGLIREGDLIIKSNDKDIYDSFYFFYTIFCGFNVQFYE